MKITRLHHAYDFPGFKAMATVREHPGNPSAVIVALKRTYEKKDQNARTVVPATLTGMTGAGSWSGTSTAAPCVSIWTLIFGVYSARSAEW